MKNIFIISLVLTSILTLNSKSFANDLFLQTRVEQNSLNWLIDKTRVIFNNSDTNDHFSGETIFHDDVNFTIDEMTQDSDYQQLRDLFSSVFKIDLKNAAVRLRIPKLAYVLNELHVKPLNLNVVDPALNLKLKAMIRGLSISLTQGIEFDLMITNPNTKKPESYLTARLKPTTITIPDTLEPMSFDVEFETKRDHGFNYTLKNQDFSAVPHYINRNLEKFLVLEMKKNKPISADSMTVNPVIIRLNELNRTIKFDAFKAIIQKRMDKIISMVFTSVGNSVESKIGTRILKEVFSDKTRSDLIVNTSSLYTRFNTSLFSQPTNNQLYLGVNGELCTAESYQRHHEQCVYHEEILEPVRSISEGDRSNAKSEITESIARGDHDLVLSFSEEYINRLLHTTIQANLWNSSLEKQHLALGPKGAFMLFNQRTQKPELYLDVLYLGEGKIGENLLVNERKPIHFPLRISTSIEFTNQKGIPHLIVKTQKILSDQYEIINGIPEYDLESKLIRGFKRKVSKMILEMSAKIEGQEAMDLDIPVLKNIDLEKTTVEASPFGRLNLFFKL